MPKIGMQQLRRQQLIDATFAAVHEHGLADTTIARISRRAGVSGGIIAHYFGDKDALLEATMRHLLGQLATATRERRTDKASPQTRLRAIVEGNFAPAQTHTHATRTWLSFWAQAQHHPALARLQLINHRRLHSNLCHALRALLPAAQALRCAETTAALIDGLWLRGALSPGGINAAHASALVCDYLQSQIGPLE